MTERHVPLVRATRDAEIEGLGRSVTDFWEWAYGSLGANATRGVLAEFIVGSLLDCLDEGRVPWAAYDLRYRGHPIEVKSAAYLQDWKQTSDSTITFGVKPTYPGEVTTETPRERDWRSHCYVFCLVTERDRSLFDPRKLEQWEFRVVATDLLRREGRVSAVTPRWLDVHNVNVVAPSALKREVDLVLDQCPECVGEAANR